MFYPAPFLSALRFRAIRARSARVALGFGLSAAALLCHSSLNAQEQRPEVRDQNRSGAPQAARKAEPAEGTAAAADAFEKGMAALEASRFPEAAQHLESAVKLAPDDVASRFYLTTALVNAGRATDALPHFEKLVAAQPDVFEIRLNYGHTLVGLKQFEAALTQLERANELKPGDARVLYQLGYAELASGSAEDARTRFTEVLKATPDDADARYGLAQASLQLGDLERAETDLRDLAKQEPRYAESLLDVADAYQRQGDLTKAAELYAEFPANPEAAQRAGELLVELGKAEEALSSLESATEKEPSFANRRNLAAAYLRASQPDKAAAVLQLAVDAEPSNPETHLALGRVLRDIRKFPLAADSFKAALKLDPTNAPAWGEYAGVAMLAGDPQASLDAIGQIEKLGKLTAGHHYLRAIILDRYHNDELALAEYQRFLALSQGQNEDEEFKARQRVRILSKKKRR